MIARRALAAAALAMALATALGWASRARALRWLRARRPPVATRAPATDPVRIAVDAARRHPISPLVYGVNFHDGYGANDLRATLTRHGGNRLTAFNWRTNDSNCGNDCGSGFPNDRFLASGLRDPDAPGAVVGRELDRLRQRRAPHALVLTVPTAGWVAADHAGDTAPPATAPDPDTPARPGRRFVRSLPTRPAAPEPGDVYQDDLVRWIQARRPGAATDPVHPVLFALDNEPDLWGSTHAELRGRTADGVEVRTGFEELVERTVAYAGAVKDAAPGATVLAPGLSGWYGLHGLGHRRPPPGRAWYLDYFLERTAAAGKAQGRRLVDVLDVHWYPEARNVCAPGETPCWSERTTNDWQPQTASVIEARVQAPRSLWDPAYVEESWVARSVPGCADATGCPVQLLPRLRASVDRHAPGTRIAITEYYFGRGGDISGALAQADALGIFGREGVYAAALWPSASVYAYNRPAGACNGDASCATLAYRCIAAAFRTFRDFDGRGDRLGDWSVAATTSDVERISVYAGADAERGGRLTVVALNKSTAQVEVALDLAGAAPPSATASVHRVTGGVGACDGPRADGTLRLGEDARAAVTLPPHSITVWAFGR